LRSWSGVFDNPPLCDDVAPPFAQVHLLGRGPDLLRVRGGKIANGGALTALQECPL
jgi:hypothetical protein